MHADEQLCDNWSQSCMHRMHGGLYLANLIVVRCDVANETPGSLIHSNAAPQERWHNLILKLCGGAPTSILLPMYTLKSLHHTFQVSVSANQHVSLCILSRACSTYSDFCLCQSSLDLITGSGQSVACVFSRACSTTSGFGFCVKSLDLMPGSGRSVVAPLWQPVLPLVWGPFTQHKCFKLQSRLQSHVMCT